ncbi:unnamed protein product [Miscanthus lutarioriparius]|uniref:3-oxo-5-alpha-steroid 4-dehydrogenase C-terminal domain-containing protein n=1 Tax=Miscanthus lutarioriparius TaxID=422564 RepID=A0A811NTS6_9POAL|nr:unnamed protein product [Miscanthus lutarioriparius]
MTWPTPLFLYAPSPLVAGASAAGAVVMAFLAISEFRGDNLTYSKFWRCRGGGGQGRETQQQQQRAADSGCCCSSPRSRPSPCRAPSTACMRTSSAPPWPSTSSNASSRYSGSMPLATSLLIAGCYLFNGGAMIYVQHLSRGLPEPSMDLLYPGVLAFAVGLAGNFYHHHLLSRLRADSGGDGDDKKVYKIPTGALFGLVTCPHYLFEILAFFGFAMMAQTRSTRSPWPWARRRTSLAGDTPPGGGTIPSSTSSRPGSN